MTPSSARPATVRLRGPFAVVLVLLLLGVVGSSPAGSQGQAQPIYWGAWISGETYGREDAPFDTATIETFEANAGKRVSILHWGQPWYWGSQGGYQPFQETEAERVRVRGAIPMISWGSWDLDAGGAANQPNFRLRRILDGAHDAHIRQWARDARDWGHPLFVRFNHEMNGNWYPWSEGVNGNASGQFAPMWRHVVDIFRQEGATNVTWVWAPNQIYGGAIPLEDLYPGDGWVDWTGISGYNWGTNPATNGFAWLSFNEVNRFTYDVLGSLAPNKPVMIAETASSEVGGSKAAWILDTLRNVVPSWPRVKAFVWFNRNEQNIQGQTDWTIETSPSAQAAFADGISSPFYAADEFANLPVLAPVAPPGGPAVPLPASAPTVGPSGAIGPSPAPPTASAARRAAIAQARSRRRGLITTLSGPTRCLRGRSCLRIRWRAPARPPSKVRYWVRVREGATGRTIVRRSGRMGAGRLRRLTIPITRRPRCGRMIARVTIRATGKRPRVLVRRGIVRRHCVSPKNITRRG